MNKAIFKFNGGIGAVLCSKCNVVIRSGGSMTEEDWEGVRGEITTPPQYCQECLLNDEEEYTECCGYPYVEDELGLCSNPECREHV